MKLIKFAPLVFLAFVVFSTTVFAQDFSLQSILSYPFPNELTSGSNTNRIAWTMNEQGKRNIYIADAPAFIAKKITDFNTDDGQELTSVSISNSGEWVVFVKGGDHSGRDGGPVNATSDPLAPKIQVVSVRADDGKMNIIAEGDYPSISPDGKNIAFIKNGQAMISPIDGSSAAKSMFYARGNTGSLSWSPDGSQLAFVSSRVDHSFIGIFAGAEKSIQWILPAFSKDFSPRWSPDGKHLAFIRTPGSGGGPDSILARRHQPWAIWKADVSTGTGMQLWKAPETHRGSYPSTEGGSNLHWAEKRIVFVSYEDGWPHLYSIDENGGNKILLTSGNFMVEHIKLSPDKKSLVFSANYGKEEADIDRRHIYKVAVDNANMSAITTGEGIETYPVFIGKTGMVAGLTATPKRPLLPAFFPGAKKISLIAEDLIPKTFPSKKLVTPKQIIFKSSDGTIVHGQLFERENKGVKKNPAVVYVHGGPQRQMVLGWHHMDYYAIDYALNQYLANLGFSVLSVNYRLGVGYGYDFQRAKNTGAQGAAEYLDVKAAGEWLAGRPNIDANRIGIYGGSYGGFLAALGLGKDSRLFAAGVDIHGVNNRFRSNDAEPKDTAPDAALAEQLAAKSSPVSYLSTWTSPTLIIHADDDRNVPFSQSVDLARRFEDKKFDFEYLSIPDDTHHWMKFTNALKVSEVTAEFLKKHLLKK